MWWVGVAIAQTTADPALLAVSEGDRAWWTGERADGVRAWREALDRADDGTPEGRAAEVMARLRLMRAGSTLSPLVHGPPIERALDACWVEERWDGPWCALAAVDYHLLTPEGIGDRDYALELARWLLPELPAEAAARVALATRDTSGLASLDPSRLDGLGTALLAGPAPEPGPWVLGIGVLAGPQTGFGGGLHLVHPDVGRRWVRIGLDGFVALRAASVSGWMTTPGTVGAIVAVDAQRWPWYDAATGELVPVDTARLATGMIWRPGRATLEVGPVARWDVDRLTGPEPLAGHGVWASGWVGLLDEARLQLRGTGEWTVPGLADYTRLGGVVDVRGRADALGGEVAARVRAEGAMGTMPEARLPTVGGAYVLRGARYGELRGPWALAGDLELRHEIVGVLWGAAFLDGAVVADEGAHGGGGAGIRLRMPPRPHNTVRLDVAWTDVGWGVYAAWGEAF